LTERLAVGFGLFLLVAATAVPVKAALWRRSTTGTDLWYSGFLHAEASHTTVDGSVYEFENGYFHGERDGSFDLKGSLHADGLLRSGLQVNSSLLFDTRYRRYPQRYWDRRFWDTFRMKVVMDTPRAINDRWKLHAAASYDREDDWRYDYPDARLLMEPIDDARLEAFAHLESRSLILEGGDLKPDYGGRGFVLYQRDLLGLRTNLHNETVATDLIGGRLKGTTFLQTPEDSLGIRADGTAGPYRLAHAPIVRGSEVVAIEVRDRFDASILVSRTLQRRNIDYTVDYLRGVITFMAPVPSETFESHPIFLSVQYAFDDREAGYRRYLAAARTEAKLADGVKASVAYAGVADDASSWRGDRSDRPPAQQLAAYGTTLELDPFDRTHLEATAALSDSGRLGDEAHNGALGLHLESRDLPRLTIAGDYQRIGHEFVPLDNRSLVGQRNRQEVKVEATLRAAGNLDLSGGQRHVKTADPQFVDLAYTDRATFAGVRYRPFAHTELGLRQEWRAAVDTKIWHQKDDARETATLDASQGFGRAQLRLAAERERYTDDAHPGLWNARTATWRLRGGLELQPGSLWGARLVGKTEAIQDRSAARTRQRRDRAEAGVTLKLTERYAFRGETEWQADYALDAAGWALTGGTRERQTGALSLGADLRPVSPIQLLLAHDRERTRNDGADALERQSEASRVEAYWFLTPDLELHGAAGIEDLRDARKIGIAQGLLRRFERRGEADVTYNWSTRLSFFAGMQWKLRRIFDPGRGDTELRRLRAGLNLHLHRDWELTGRVSHARLDGEPIAWSDSDPGTGAALENHRWIASGEVAWDASRMWRLAAGYESLEHAIDSAADSSDDYAADRVYLKVMQKF
jgi:hypothetical protein